MSDESEIERCRRAIAPLTQFLPRAERARWEEEWTTDLYDLRNSPLSTQIRYTFSIAIAATVLVLRPKRAPSGPPRTLSVFALLTGDRDRYASEYAAEWYDVQSWSRMRRLAYLARVGLRAGAMGINSLRKKLSRT